MPSVGKMSGHVRDKPIAEIPPGVDEAPRILRLVALALDQEEIRPAECLRMQALILEGHPMPVASNCPPGKKFHSSWARKTSKERRVERIPKGFYVTDRGVRVKVEAPVTDSYRYKQQAIEMGLLNEDGSVKDA